MEVGSTTAFEVLAKEIPWPLDPAAAFNRTEQEFVPFPVIVLFAQLNCFTWGIPLPVSLIFLEFVELLELAFGVSWLFIAKRRDELVLSVSSPFTFPAPLGKN
jgi:hypothetical protein